MKMEDIKIGEIYYIVTYETVHPVVADSKPKSEWNIICRRIEQKEALYEMCSHKTGWASASLVFDNIKAAIAKKNIMNHKNRVKQNNMYYRGRVIWLRVGQYGLVKSVITSVEEDGAVSFNAKVNPKTEFGKTFPDFEMRLTHLDLNKKFVLVNPDRLM